MSWASIKIEKLQSVSCEPTITVEISTDGNFISVEEEEKVHPPTEDDLVAAAFILSSPHPFSLSATRVEPATSKFTRQIQTNYTAIDTRNPRCSVSAALSLLKKFPNTNRLAIAWSKEIIRNQN